MLAYHWSPTENRASIRRFGLRTAVPYMAKAYARAYPLATFLRYVVPTVSVAEDPEAAWAMLVPENRPWTTYDLWEVSLFHTDRLDRWPSGAIHVLNPIPPFRVNRTNTTREGGYKTDPTEPSGNQHPRRSEADNGGWELFTPRRSSART